MLRLRLHLPRALSTHLPTVFALFCLIAFSTRPTLAQGSGPVELGAEGLEIVSLDIGFSGKYKVGFWTPVTIGIRSPQSTHCDVVIGVPDPDGAEVAFSVGAAPTAELVGGSTTRLVRYCKFGRNRPAIRVRVRDAEGRVAQRTFSGDAVPTSLSSTSNLILAIGGDVGWTDAARRIGGDFEHATIQQVTSATNLPDQWFGYESVNTLAVTCGDGEALEALSEVQIRAVRDWVRLGGQLILSCGRSGTKLLAPGGKLESLSPGKFIRTQPLLTKTNLERFVESTQRVPDSNELQVSVLDLGTQPSELSESLGVWTMAPIVARVPLGFGTIVWVGIDLDSSVIKKWPGGAVLVRRILGGTTSSRVVASARNELGDVSRLGYRDIIGQLRGAMDQFSGVQIIGFSVVVSLLIAYLAIVGPGDFFALRNLRIPPIWTWITFPLVTAGVTWGAIWLNTQAKGAQRKTNQLDLVDYDVASGTIRGTTWTHIFSPQDENLTVKLRPQVMSLQRAPTVLASWHGLPGDGLGGLDSKSESAPFTTPYSLQQESLQQESLQQDSQSPSAWSVQFDGLPIYVAATRSLLFRWSSDFSPSRLDKLSADVDGVLVGEVGNVFDVTLTRCELVYNNWMYKFDRPLRAGQKLNVDRVRPLNLQWQLTERQVIKQADQATPWDPASTDMNRLLDIMLLYQAAGGESYTRLTNLYQPYLDFSPRIRGDWAVLMGYAEKPACELTVNSRSETWPENDIAGGNNWTVYRMVVPVTRKSANR